MSLTATMERLAAVGGEVSGITTSFSKIPRRIQDAELPALVPMPGQSRYDYTTHGEEVIEKPRSWRIWLYVERAQFGVEGEYQTTTTDLIDSVANHFLSRPGIKLASSAEPQDKVYDSKVVGDSGFQYLSYPPNAQLAPEYIGSVIELEVEEITEIVYVD